MKELLPAILCIVIMIYIIYTELRNKRVERDYFVDTSISIIIMIVGVYSMYEYQFNFSLRVVQAYVVLLLLGIAYLVIVFVRGKKQNVQGEEQTAEGVVEESTTQEAQPQAETEEHQNDQF